MKKRSKLLLIVAAALVGVGLITCLVGAGVSSAAGDPLFAEKLADGKGYRYDFDGSKIDKINLDVVDAQIQVTGGAEESYMEILSFNENLYSFSQSKSLITFKESPDVSSILRFWESGFTFKGMRYILRPAPRAKDRAIHIYLTDEDFVKCLEIKSQTGNITVQNMHTDTDYLFSMENGSVHMDNVNTGSALSVISTGGDPCTVRLQDTTARLLTLDLMQGDVQTQGLSAYTSKIDVTHGSLSLNYIPRETVFTIQASTRGKLSVNETGYIDTYQYTTKDANADPGEETPEETVTIQGKDAAIYISIESLPQKTSGE